MEDALERARAFAEVGADGIMNEDTSSSGTSLYFGVAVIKLLSLTSVSYYQILKNSKKLNTYIKPRGDALKVIHKKEQGNDKL